MDERTVVLDRHLSLEDFVAVVRGGARVALSDAARAARRRPRAGRAHVAEGAPVYGVNTGFGKLQNVRIAAATCARCSATWCCRTLRRGRAVPDGEVRAAAAAADATRWRAAHSGVRAELVERAARACSRRGVRPAWCPQQGSVGA